MVECVCNHSTWGSYYPQAEVVAVDLRDPAVRLAVCGRCGLGLEETGKWRIEALPAS